MDNRPIGFLDSGVGGLTVVRELFRQLPNEEIIYIGDSARAPYGTRPDDEILTFTWQMVNFLMAKDVKMIVFACNTATAVALDTIKEKLAIPVLGVILPGASSAIQKTKSGQIGVIGTPASIKSNAYARTIKAKSPSVEVLSLACPSFVPIVEANEIENSQAIVTKDLQPLVGKVDTLLLGCTHYPLLKAQIAETMGPGVRLIDSGAETVRDISVLLNYFYLNRKEGATHHPVFYTTGDVETFRQIGQKWLGRSDLTIKEVKL